MSLTEIQVDLSLYWAHKPFCFNMRCLICYTKTSVIPHIILSGTVIFESRTTIPIFCDVSHRVILKQMVKPLCSNMR